MAYSPTNAAREVVKQIATSLASIGPAYQNLLNAVNSTPPPGFNIAGAEAPIDGWLKPAVQGQATTFQLGAEDITGDGSWHTVASSAWTITPYCPRDMTLVASICGRQNAAVPLPLRVRFDGNVVATATLSFPTTTVMSIPLSGVVAAAWVTYPLATQTIDFQVKPDGAVHYLAAAADCAVSYALF